MQEIDEGSTEYRAILVLRDPKQLSTEEVATALGLRISTLKTCRFRGRLMLLTAHCPDLE